MLTAWLVGDTEVIAQLDAAPGRLRQGIARAVTKFGLDLQRRVQAGKLSGQVLKVRTGTLRSSINFRGPVETASGVTGTVGTNVKYAAVHEFGFHGAVSVRAYIRTVNQVFGRPITAVQHVGAHTRQVNLPERSFLRSAFAELRPQFAADLETAAREALH